jgi:hypothetical protein
MKYSTIALLTLAIVAAAGPLDIYRYGKDNINSKGSQIITPLSGSNVKG